MTQTKDTLEMTTSTLAPVTAKPRAPKSALTIEQKLGNHGFAVVKTFNEAKTEIAMWTQIKKDAQNELEDLFGAKYTKGAQGVYRNVPAIKVMANSNTSVDLKALEQAFPEAYAATVRKTPYLYFK